jgi:hypothetical protein
MGEESGFGSTPAGAADGGSFACYGYATMVGGTPLAGATVEVLNVNNIVLTSGTTTSIGFYGVAVSDPAAQPGTTFTVRISKAYFQTVSVTKAKVGTWQQNFQPTCTGQHWYGWVRDQDNNALASARVRINSFWIGTLETYTDPSGKWDLVTRAKTLLDPAPTLNVSKTGYDTFARSNFAWSSGDYRRDVILADNTPPTIIGVTINSGLTYTNSEEVSVRVRASDASNMRVWLRNDGGSYTYQGSFDGDESYDWSLASGDGPKTGCWLRSHCSGCSGAHRNA